MTKDVLEITFSTHRRQQLISIRERIFARSQIKKEHTHTQCGDINNME